jgi:hypothetical protein
MKMKNLFTALLFTTGICGLANAIQIETEAIGESYDEAIEAAHKKALVEAYRRTNVKIYGVTVVKDNTFVTNLILQKIKGKVSCELKGKPKWETINIEGKPYVKVKSTYECKVDSQLNKDYFGMNIFAPSQVKAYDNYTIEVTVKKPCYLYVYNVDSKEHVYLVYPSNENPRLIKKNITLKLKAYPLPGEPLPQRETLLFLCSNETFPQLSQEFINLKKFKDVKKCLEDKTCIPTVKESDFWKKVSKVEDWDIAIQTFEITNK